MKAGRPRRGSASAGEMAARMRDAGYEDWEVAEELASKEDAEKTVARHTAMLAEAGRLTDVEPDRLASELRARRRPPTLERGSARRAAGGTEPARGASRTKRESGPVAGKRPTAENDERSRTMAEIEKEAWGRIRTRSARTPLDPHDEEALQAACHDNGLHAGAGPSFMPLATEDDLAYVLHGGGWSRGTGFVYKDLAFMEQGGDEWAAFTSADDGAHAWRQFDSMSFATASQTPEEVARTVSALAIATADERMRGEWRELLGALDGDRRLRWEHAVSPQEALDGTVKACRSLRAERDGVTVAVYERASYPGWTVVVFEGPMGGKRAPGRAVNIESLSEAISLAERRASEHAQRPACPDWNSPFLTDELRQELYDKGLSFKRPNGSLPPGFGVWTDAHGWLMDYVPETKGMVIEETTGMAVMSWDGAAYSDPITGEPRSFDAGAGRPGMRREDAEAVLAAALELDPTLGGKLPAPAPDVVALHRFDYMLLSRLKQDCDYYLGYGNRAEKHLWAGDVDSQVAKMRELYAALPEKPEWLTADQIDEYERRMAPSAEDGARTKLESGPVAGKRPTAGNDERSRTMAEIEKEDWRRELAELEERKRELESDIEEAEEELLGMEPDDIDYQALLFELEHSDRVALKEVRERIAGIRQDHPDRPEEDRPLVASPTRTEKGPCGGIGRERSYGRPERLALGAEAPGASPADDLSSAESASRTRNRSAIQQSRQQAR